MTPPPPTLASASKGWRLAFAGAAERTSHPWSGTEQGGGTDHLRFLSDRPGTLRNRSQPGTSPALGSQVESPPSDGGGWRGTNAAKEGVVRILTVDDDPGIVRVVGEAFEDAGYGMTVARTGPDALLDARLNDYDLIVLDVMLPGLDGIEIARRLRAEGVTTPILMLTARDRERDKIAGL